MKDSKKSLLIAPLIVIIIGFVMWLVMGWSIGWVMILGGIAFAVVLLLKGNTSKKGIGRDGVQSESQSADSPSSRNAAIAFSALCCFIILCLVGTFFITKNDGIFLSNDKICIVCEEELSNKSIFCEEHQYLKEEVDVKNTKKLLDEVMEEKNLWNTDNSKGFYEGFENSSEVVSDDGLIGRIRTEAYGEDFCVIEEYKYTSAIGTEGAISFSDTIEYKGIEVFELYDFSDEEGNLAVSPLKGTQGLYAKEYGDLTIVYLKTGKKEYFDYLAFIYRGECLNVRSIHE